MSLENLIAHFGIAAVFVGAASEGEAAAATGGFLAHRGLLPLWPVAAAVYAGALVSGQLMFVAGRISRTSPWIRRLTERPGYARVLAALDRRPVLLILAYRFIFGLKTLTPIVLGMSSIQAGRFAFLNAVAAAIWSLVFTTLGYWFGAGVERVFGRLPSLHHLAIGAGVALTVGAGVWLWHHSRQGRAA